MNKHLSKNTIDLVSNYDLSGDALFDALTHLESCESCRERIPGQGESLRVRLEADSKTGSVSWSFAGFFESVSLLRLARVGALALLVLTAGVVIWQLTSTPGPNELARGEDNPIDAAPTVVPQSSSEAPGSEAGPESPTSEPGTPSGPTAAEAVVDPAGRLPNVPQKVTGLPDVIGAPATRTSVEPNIATDKEALESFLTTTPRAVTNLRPDLSGSRNTVNPANSGSVLSPSGEVIRDSKPRFRWKPVTNASSYRFLLMDENFDEVLSLKTQQNGVEITKGLSRGRVYLWKVMAESEAGPISIPAAPNPPAMFSILTKKQLRKLDALKKNHADEWALLRFQFENGLLTESQATVNSILKKNPEDELAKRLQTKISKLLNEN